MTVPAGQDPHRVSRFRALDSSKAMPIKDTYGPLFSDSSPSADLQFCLVSRLAELLDTNGSPEFELTWKQRDMPAGLPICLLQALARRTSDSDYSGWPTPLTSKGRRSVATSREAILKRVGKANLNLDEVAHLASWATPRSVKRGHSHGNPDRAMNHKSRLEDQVFLAKSGSPVMTEGRAALNPDFTRWLMLFPRAWQASAPKVRDWLKWQDLMERLSEERENSTEGPCRATETP